MTREETYIFIENNFGIARSIMATYFKYLDDLAQSNMCDIMDAPNYLVTQFGVTYPMACDIVKHWSNCMPN